MGPMNCGLIITVSYHIVASHIISSRHTSHHHIFNNHDHIIIIDVAFRSFHTLYPPRHSGGGRRRSRMRASPSASPSSPPSRSALGGRGGGPSGAHKPHMGEEVRTDS